VEGIEGGILVVVWIEVGECGGEADAGRLLDRIITLQKVLAYYQLWTTLRNIGGCEVEVSPRRVSRARQNRG
jgi:hypothetical protein